MTGLLQNQSLQTLNTLALPGNASQFFRLEQIEQLASLAPYPQRFILGGGSNLVIQGDIDELVIHVCLPGKQLRGEDADAWYVAAAAGEPWHEFVQWTLGQGWPGLENLSLIPGTVGAAPIQNIGAYGLEIAERLHELTAFDFSSGEFRKFTAADCRFSYRDSIFKQEAWHLSGRFLITELVFRLPKHWLPNTRYADIAETLAACKITTPTPQDVAAAIIAVRQAKLPDPAKTPNAGSFFQNPIVTAEQAAKLKAEFPALPAYPQTDGRVKLAAGWLIEQAGWKGRAIGPVGMYEKQALVLVNHGSATGKDLIRTIKAVQADVQARFGIALHPEPIFIGRPAD